MAPAAHDPDQWQRILDAAARMFAEHGFDEVTMAAIAGEADVARATVFNYFGSKHSLVEAITETVLDVWRVMLDTALADEHTPTPDLLRDLCAQMGAGIEAQRPLFRKVFVQITRIQLGFDGGDVAQRANEAARIRLRRLIERGQERGELSREFDAETLGNAFHSLTSGTITNWLYHDPDGSLAAQMRDVAEVFLSPVERRTRGVRTKGARG
jgi:AcrR family transcriptional regulator